MKEITTIKTRHLSNKIKSYASIIACVAFYLLPYQSFAATKNTHFYPGYQSDLKKIASYLNNLKYLSAKFIQETSQENNGGSVVEGDFYLSRPGKMRIEYKTNPKIVIVVNGAILTYHDVELDEISRLRTNTTPASFLTRKHISFDAKDVEITNVERTESTIRVSVMKKNRKEAGEFSLIFSRKPFQFIKMEVKNDLDQIIGVTLTDKDFSTPISRKRFIIKKTESE